MPGRKSTDEDTLPTEEEGAPPTDYENPLDPDMSPDAIPLVDQSSLYGGLPPAEEVATLAHDEPGPPCPDCGTPMHVYDGDVNPHKIGQAHCSTCGERKPLPVGA